MPEFHGVRASALMTRGESRKATEICVGIGLFVGQEAIAEGVLGRRANRDVQFQGLGHAVRGCLDGVPEDAVRISKGGR